MPEITLALGSNLGDRKKNLEEAIILLQEKINIDRISAWLENRAVGGPPGQSDFLNGALTGTTILSAEELLKFVKTIERRLGRDFTSVRWSAREIDIDIIFYGDSIIDTPALQIPHLLMHKRDFVLIPLTEIIPDYIHPQLRKSVLQLKNEL